jgi:hypothetical protein
MSLGLTDGIFSFANGDVENLLGKLARGRLALPIVISGSRISKRKPPQK